MGNARTPDSFELARRIYRRRRSLFAQAARLLAEADPKVRALVDSIEEEEAHVEPPATPKEDPPV